MKSQRFTASHIAKSLEKPNARPKLVKKCVCPNTRQTAKLIANGLKMNKGQLVTRNIRKPGDVGILNFCTFKKKENQIVFILTKASAIKKK